MLGAEGPFTAQEEGGLSAFQVQMEQVGLPIVTVKATGFRILSGQEGVSLNENVRIPSCKANWHYIPWCCSVDGDIYLGGH